MAVPGTGSDRRSVVHRARARAALAIACALLAAGPPAAAYVPGTGSPQSGVLGVVPRWDLAAHADGAIPFTVDLTRPASLDPAVTDAQLLDAIFNAFVAWEWASTSSLRFRFAGTDSRGPALDLVNVVRFAPPDFAFPPGSPPTWTSVALALAPGPVTVPGAGTIVAAFAGQIIDADILINPAHEFAVGGEAPPAPPVLDLQGVLTQEVGHFLGLDHTGIQGASMYGEFGSDGGFSSRTPERDDAIGAMSLYPPAGFVESTGRIGGTVQRGDGQPVFGAHVLAVDPAGVVVASAISGLIEVRPDGMPLRFSAGSGTYLLTGLPPGEYTVLAEPLDGPDQVLPRGIFGIESDFLPSAGVIVSAEAAQELPGLDLVVEPRTPDAPNLAGLSSAAPEGATPPSHAAAPAGGSV
jgi:hypothetical protein